MNLSFANAKQPYLEADRPIGKSLSRGRERKGNSPVDYFSEQPGGTARDLGIGPRRQGNVRWEEVSQAAQPSGSQ